MFANYVYVGFYVVMQYFLNYYNNDRLVIETIF